MDGAALEREARRIYLRYALEVVEAHNFCPWAKSAREAGRVALRVIRGATADLSSALEQLARLSADSSVDIGLLLFPELTLDRRQFARFTAGLREADSGRCGRGHTVFALAEFHPQAEPDASAPERLTPFIRRSPDPTIQCVRRSVLAEVRMGEDRGTSYVDPGVLDPAALARLAARPDPLHERVARANLRTFERVGRASLEAVHAAIAADRRRSYAALGLAAAPWDPAGREVRREPERARDNDKV